MNKLFHEAIGGDTARAVSLARQAVREGQEGAVAQLAVYLARAIDLSYAERLAMVALEAGATECLDAVVDVFEELGHSDRAQFLLREKARRVDYPSPEALLEELEELDKLPSVRDVILRAADQDRASPEVLAVASPAQADEAIDEAVAPDLAVTAGMSVDLAMAKLFLRLGSPPEPTALEYAPSSSGGGGTTS
ncbi:hypothetical protein [Kitasatospora sp. NPDC059599]|uniref:hypothetical protein n=1 Tax=Kitasatospora sp. NPDC059599 TaxID=3346880 RepID=UPI0036A56781